MFRMRVSCESVISATYSPTSINIHATLYYIITLSMNSVRFIPYLSLKRAGALLVRSEAILEGPIIGRGVTAMAASRAIGVP